MPFNEWNDDPRFAVRQLTDAINIIPNQYNFLGDIGVFVDHPIDTLYVELEFGEGNINLIPTSKRGGPGYKNKPRTRKTKPFKTLHLQLEDSVLADSVQNVREFATEAQLESVFGKVDEVMFDMARKHQQTIEFLRWGALKGKIYDADGTTVLLDLYSELGVTQTSIDLLLGSANIEDVNTACRQISRHIELNLKGETYSGVLSLVSPGLFDKLMAHADIREAHMHFMQRQNPLKEDVRRGFVHQGILFMEHLGRANFYAEDGSTSTMKFVPDNEGIAMPMGTQSVFKTYYSPADYIETVNTLGEPLYAKTEPMKYGKGLDVETQSNPLPLTKRPELVTRLHTST